jgi:hypothetical protein
MSDPRWLRFWLAVSPALALLGCSSGDCDLVDDLRLFAGESAIDCGTADASKDRAEVDQCAVDAFEAKQAFFARYERDGEDSKLQQAVAMNSASAVKIFRWDSSPCGGGSCNPATDVQSCEEPSPLLETSEDDTVLPIQCEEFGLTQRICGG